MKVLLQRVSSASVNIGAEIVGSIEVGLLLLTGLGHADSGQVLQPMARKIANMRVFPDQKGRFSYSLLDTGGGVLIVPQFTLYADTGKGRRPDFTAAMPPEAAARLFDAFTDEVRATGIERIQTGRFGADMQVSLVNDGPVTILVES